VTPGQEAHPLVDGVSPYSGGSATSSWTLDDDGGYPTHTVIMQDAAGRAVVVEVAF